MAGKEEGGGGTMKMVKMVLACGCGVGCVPPVKMVKMVKIVKIVNPRSTL